VSTDGQFCPVSKAMELLDERWTTLVVRELLLGSRHFNEPIVDALGQWGIHWIPELGDDDLDPHVLLWEMHRNVNLPAVPDGRTVLRFQFSDVRAGAREWCMLITPDGADRCDFDPGHPERACVQTDLRSLAMLWRDDLGWPEVLRSGRVEIQGPAWARRAVPRWLGQSPLASVPRPAAVS
jgi:hypothetical protein